VLAQIPYQLVKLRAKLKEQDNAGKGRRPKALKAVTVKPGMYAEVSLSSTADGVLRPMLFSVLNRCC
jgi:hypothetical protein